MSKPKRSTAKPSRELSDEQLVARLPAALLARVDAFAERMRAELPGSRFARAEAVRVLLSRALDDAEKKARK